MQKEQLIEWLTSAIRKANLSDTAVPALERPKQAEHGDWAGTLQLNGQTLDTSTHFVQAQDLQAQHLFVDAPLAAGQSLELNLWTLDSRGALGQQQHLYLQVVI